MIYDGRTFAAATTLRCEVCVIGSGAGGLTAATMLAEAGVGVLVLEPGAMLAPEAMTQREEQMMPQLYWDAGARTTADRVIHLHQGKGVGGSTLHNLNLCKRIAPPLLARWARERKLSRLQPAAWDALFAETEALLGVSKVAEAQWNRHNRLLYDGAGALGWRRAGLSHNRDGCVGSGFCALGCAFDAKNNAAKVLLPRLIRAGGAVVSFAQAVRLDIDGGRVVGVDGVTLAREGVVHGALRVDSDAVVVAASATGTPALLARSGVGDRSGRAGRGLAIHPAVVAAGVFAEPVRAWSGIPQTVECSEFLDVDHAEAGGAAGAAAVASAGGEGDAASRPSRIWIVPAFGHPMGTATMMPGHGQVHRELMTHYDRTAVFCAMLHDDSDGAVHADGDLGLRVDYRLSPADRGELRRGLWRLVELLRAAGAERVVIPTPRPLVLGPADALDVLAGVDIAALRPTAVHPMATMAMSDDPTLGPVDSAGRHHGVAGLWVADGSLYPSSIGGPPQLGIYALGLHVGRAAAVALGAAGG